MNPFCREKKINFIAWNYGKIYNTKELYSIVSHENVLGFEWRGKYGDILFLETCKPGARSSELVIKYVETNLPAKNMFIRSVSFKREENKIIICDRPNYAIDSMTNFIFCFSHGLILVGFHDKMTMGNEIDLNEYIMVQFIVPLFETFFRQKIISDTPFANSIRSGVYKKLNVHPSKNSLGNYFSVGTDGENLLMEKTFPRKYTAATYHNYDWNENLPVKVEMKKISYTRKRRQFYICEEKINKEDIHHFNRPTYTIFEPKNKIILYYFKQTHIYNKKMKDSYLHEDFDDWSEFVHDEMSMDMAEMDHFEDNE